MKNRHRVKKLHWTKIVLLVFAGFLVVSFILDPYITCYLLESLNRESISATTTEITYLFIGLWISLYIIVRQIGYNKEINILTRDVIKITFYEGITHLFVLLCLTILRTSVSSSYEIFALVHLLASAYSFYYLVRSMFTVFDKLELKRVLRNEVNGICDEIANTVELDALKRKISQIIHIYNESVFQENIELAKYIIISYYSILKKHFIEEPRILLAEDSKNNHKQLDSTQISRIINGYFADLFRYGNSFIEQELRLVVISVVFEQLKNVYKCNIDNKTAELFSLFNEVAYRIDEESSISFFDQVSYQSYQLCKEAIRDGRISFVKGILKEVSDLYEELEKNHKVHDRVYLSRVYANLILHSYDNEIADFTTEMIGAYRDYIIENIDQLDKTSLSFVIKRVKSDRSDIVKTFVETMLEIQKYVNVYSSERTLSYITGIYRSLINVVGKTEPVLNALCDYEVRMLEKSKNLDITLLFDWEDIILSTYSDSDFEFILDHQKHCLVRAVYSNQQELLKMCLDNVDAVLLTLFEKDKPIQQKWLRIYFKVFGSAMNTTFDDMIELSVYRFEKLLLSLDEKKTISQDLGLFIISELYKTAYNAISRNAYLSNEIVDMLGDLVGKSEDYDFRVFLRHDELVKSVNEALFTLAVDAIEKDNCTLIENVSQNLGWEIASRMEHNGKIDTIMEFPQKLFQLCVRHKVNEKTLKFLGTLYIVLGGMAVQDYPKFVKDILDATPTGYHEILALSKDLRYEADFTKGDSKKSVNKASIMKFWNEYEKRVRSK